MTFNEMTPEEIANLARPKVLGTVADALSEKFGADKVHVQTNKNRVIVERFNDEVYIVTVERRRRR